eukprot:TRINITY_DN8013_c0_g1_i1.p2 TRINITY_DN8013_c0_g1~~TRINITY_DN8013_c0_g1_i1.p2  ORF type:complete len:142 (+),score=6.50 TRINITY_DN8013_c0_g1_i1:1015-1440(+)
MPLTRGEQSHGGVFLIVVGALLFPFNIGISGLPYCWTVLVTPLVVFLYYVLVKRRSGYWPPELASRSQCDAAADADGRHMQAGDAVTYFTKKRLQRIWLVELYSSGEWRVRDSRDPRSMSCYIFNNASNFRVGHSWVPAAE